MYLLGEAWEFNRSSNWAVCHNDRCQKHVKLKGAKLSNTQCIFYTPIFRQDVLWYGDVRPTLHPSVRLCVRVSVRQFSALFSNMLRHIELKFCIWFCFTVLQINFECHQFTSIFVGVMPLLELRKLKMHSFLHFSLTCFDILSWNFAYDFVLLYFRWSLCVVNLRQFLWELCPFWNLEYWKYAVFRTFLLHALTYLAEILRIMHRLLCSGIFIARGGKAPYSHYVVIIFPNPSVLLPLDYFSRCMGKPTTWTDVIICWKDVFWQLLFLDVNTSEHSKLVKNKTNALYSSHSSDSVHFAFNIATSSSRFQSSLSN